MADPRWPRFLPSDPRVEEPYRLTPQLALRVAILGFVALAVFAVLFLRLWALQVLSGDKYRAQANDNRVRTIGIDAPRGVVKDRAGRVLVRNKPGTRVELWPADLPKSWLAQRTELRSLAAITGVPISKILNGIKENADDPLTPVIIELGIHPDQISYIKERTPSFPGVQFRESYLRSYNSQSLLAHVLGYVGEISEAELKADKKGGYRLGDIIGQAGIESTYDQYLRGRDGSAQLTVDSLGRSTSSVELKVLARAGNALQLTIDIDVAKSGRERAHRRHQAPHGNGQYPRRRRRDRGARPARRLGARAGLEPDLQAVGLRQPRSDEARAAPRDHAAAAHEDHPALDRATCVAYPPGSTWKPVTALAAMQEHILSPYSSLLCSGSYKVNGKTGKGQIFTNWDPFVNQWIDLKTALAESCDTYFYQVGYDFYNLRRTVVTLQNWASRFGFGAPTGLDVGARQRGSVPTPNGARGHRRLTVQRRRPALEAGRLDPSRNRAGRPARDAAPDGALLRDARERRQACHPAHRRGRRAGDQRQAAHSGSSHAGGAHTERSRRECAADR